jgi:hypothetical protein
MQLFNVVFERLPVVWVLLGLLFSALGLYVGFGNGLSFFFFAIGLFCLAYGVTVFVLQRIQKPEKSVANRLSPQFISAGSTADVPPPAANPRPTPADDLRDAQRAETAHG